jgi:hypothetical protein
MINCVISHTACIELVMLADHDERVRMAYCFEIHRGEFEESSKERRQAHAASSLCHGG